MNVILKIAKTHLLSKPKQTLVAMLGVTFGIGMFIMMISLMTGLNNFTEDLTKIASADIRIYKDVTEPRATLLDRIRPEGLNLVHHVKPKNESDKIRNSRQIADLLRQDPEVIGVAPRLTSQVFYNFGPVKLNGSVAGVDILEEDKLFDLHSKIKAGSLAALKTTSNGLIIGSGLAKKLSAQVGDLLMVTTPQGVVYTMKVVGIFQLGLGEIDNVRSYANLATVQKLLGKDASYITDLNLKITNYREAKAKAETIQAAFGNKAEDWETANSTLLAGAIIRDIMTYSVSITLLIVAGFGIYNILNMTIYSKMKDIAILKATGFAAKDVTGIFLTQSLIIGLIGSLMGLAVGFVFSLLLAQVPFDGGELLALDSLPVNFETKYYLIGIVFGVVTTAIAGWMPSRKAGKIDPIEIIRGI
ncbi:ABC transporter permease [Algoriphagus confluentis]|uniref:ABC transporter permease n=1 Tax=Algoriphagus confluentis TaxID=1697556 RepID=A0ABQ6PNX3_9BACT|nr:ABC transporter permease [Algoriphagus confluentis]